MLRSSDGSARSRPSRADCSGRGRGAHNADALGLGHDYDAGAERPARAPGWSGRHRRPVVDVVDRDRDRRDRGRGPANQPLLTRSGVRLGAGTPSCGRNHGVVLGRGRHRGLPVGDGAAARPSELARPEPIRRGPRAAIVGPIAAAMLTALAGTSPMCSERGRAVSSLPKPAAIADSPHGAHGRFGHNPRVAAHTWPNRHPRDALSGRRYR
jgi:hypothetical protein